MTASHEMPSIASGYMIDILVHAILDDRFATVVWAGAPLPCYVAMGVWR